MERCGALRKRYCTLRERYGTVTERYTEVNVTVRENIDFAYH